MTLELNSSSCGCLRHHVHKERMRGSVTAEGGKNDKGRKRKQQSGDEGRRYKEGEEQLRQSDGDGDEDGGARGGKNWRLIRSDRVSANEGNGVHKSVLVE